MWPLRVFLPHFNISEQLVWIFPVVPDLVQLTIVCWRAKVHGNILTSKIRGNIFLLLMFIGDFPSFLAGWGFSLQHCLPLTSLWAEMGKKCMLVSVKEICQPDIYFRTNKIISLCSPHLKWLKHFPGKKSILPKNFATQTWRTPQCSLTRRWWSFS